MKAAVRRNYGPPEGILIEDLEKPVPKDNEVLVRVKATTVNRTDCANLRAKPFIMRFVLGFLKPKKIILGTDFAGDVVATGKNIKYFHIGDRVFGFNDTGVQSQAEYLTLAENGSLFSIPDAISYEQAAASLEGAHYAYTFVHKVNIQSGQRILINGATGAIGSALLQFVRQYDVHITATCNTRNIELVESLGADKTYDYTQEDFTKDTEKYDFVFDAVGKSTYGKCKPLLKREGVYISSELGSYSQNVFFALLTSIAGKKKVIFPIPYPTQETIPYIIDLLKTKKFSPVIDREYSLHEIAQAYEYVLTGEKTGNVIITP
ncbi:NAD(P)-dependent alcohol dehydrogenase [Ulvibacterium sp.]|uniref:NAD(P)-dependent alcohol dehydrogenase n=1 Tax=Ulvibacterium sp. TaxID=2665914 RepID=UPI003CC5F73A